MRAALQGAVTASPPAGMRGVSLLPCLDPEGPDPAVPERFVVETQFRAADKIGVYASKWNYFEVRAKHRGAAPIELQRARRRENGARTNRLDEFPRIAEPRVLPKRSECPYFGPEVLAVPICGRVIPHRDTAPGRAQILNMVVVTR